MPADLVITFPFLWIGSLFVYSGSLKLLTPLDERVRAVAGFRLLSSAFARPVGGLLPYAELVCGAVILLTPFPRTGAIGAAVAGVAFSIATGSALVRGLKTECGCAGKRSGLVRPSTFARAGVLTAFAVVVAMSGSDRPIAGGWLVFALALLPAGVVILRTRRLANATAHRLHPTHIHQTIPESKLG
jgi:hypothetical protein